MVEPSPELRAAMGEGSGVKLVSARSRMEIDSKKKGPGASTAPKENGRLKSDAETFMFETDSLPALMRRGPVGVKQAPRDFEREKRAKTTSRKTSRPPSGDPDSSGEGSEEEDSDSGSSSGASGDDDEDGAEGSSGGSQAESCSSRSQNRRKGAHVQKKQRSVDRHGKDRPSFGRLTQENLMMAVSADKMSLITVFDQPSINAACKEGSRQHVKFDRHV